MPESNKTDSESKNVRPSIEDHVGFVACLIEAAKFLTKALAMSAKRRPLAWLIFAAIGVIGILLIYLISAHWISGSSLIWFLFTYLGFAITWLVLRFMERVDAERHGSITTSPEQPTIRDIGNRLMNAAESQKKVANFTLAAALASGAFGMIALGDKVFERRPDRTFLSLPQSASEAMSGTTNTVNSPLSTSSGVADRIESSSKWFVDLVPRLAFVISSELFAFFFLQLHRKSLDEIKYYRDELTTIQVRAFAVQQAKEDKVLQRELLLDLGRFDRNRGPANRQVENGKESQLKETAAIIEQLKVLVEEFRKIIK